MYKKLKPSVLLTAVFVLCSNVVVFAQSGSGSVTGNVRGPFPEIRSAGVCTKSDSTVDPDATTALVLRKASGIWQLSMDTLGANSAGTWIISYTKNGVPGPSTMVDFPAGWSQILYLVKSDKGLIEFNATAVNVSQLGDPIGDTCTAKIAMKF